MLLTLAASSLASRLADGGSGEMRLTDLPRFTREHLGLYGLNISTDLLAGAELTVMDALRESADKSQCPCLVLVDPNPLPLAASDEDKGNAAIDRVTRVIAAATRLGCNSAAVGISAPDSEEAFDNAVERLKRLLGRAERVEMNLLLSSNPGLTEQPDRLTEMIKKVGGFRIGTFPDFQTASKADDPIQYLRRLTPYASALTASAEQYKASKKAPGFVHSAYDLAAFADAVQAVGYQGTLAIDYRGKKDPVTGIRNTKAILERALGMEPEGE